MPIIEYRVQSHKNKSPINNSLSGFCTRSEYKTHILRENKRITSEYKWLIYNVI